MMHVRRLWVIHERLVVWNIIARIYHGIVTRESRVMLSAHSVSLRINARRRKSALEPSPRNPLRVQQIANVLTRHRDLIHRLKLRIRKHAVIQQWPWIANHRSRRRSVRDISRCTRRLAIRPRRRERPRKRIASNEIQSARRRRPERRSPRVVAHRKVLRVVPHRRHGISVVVAHRARRSQDRIITAELLDEQIHQPAVRRRLLVVVVVVFVARHRNARRNPERICLIRVVSDQS